MMSLGIIAFGLVLAWRAGWFSGPAEPPDYGDYRGDPNYEDEENQ